MKKGVNFAVVKWAGGKRQLINQFQEYFPKEVKRYFEPFVGGGAIAFHMIQTKNPKKVFLSDLNEELINVYEMVRDNLEELIVLLEKYQKKHSEELYYNTRKEDPEVMSKLSRAARFIYLNKTCFNGLYRVNLKGQFNVPIGSYKNPKICPEDELREMSKLLKNVQLKFQSFEKILKFARKGDFVYFDPPYYPLNKSSFTKYAKGNFLEEEQKSLFNLFKKLDKKGCNVMLSNSDSKFIKDLYKDYNISFVKATRMINCNAANRGKVNEVVVKNY